MINKLEIEGKCRKHLLLRAIYKAIKIVIERDDCVVLGVDSEDIIPKINKYRSLLGDVFGKDVRVQFFPGNTIYDLTLCIDEPEFEEVMGGMGFVTSEI